MAGAMASIDIRQVTPTRMSSETSRDISTLVNEVYTIAESGMWSEAYQRTTEERVTQLIAKGELYGAYRGEKFIGCITLHQINPETAEFGMLAVDPNHRASGAGGKLVRFVEEVARGKGTNVMECGAMMPRKWKHTGRATVAAWYMRNGYKEISREPFEEKYPPTKNFLVPDIDHISFEKKLVNQIIKHK